MTEAKLEKPKILVINGPNLNLLGSREPDKYGKESLESLVNKLRETAKRLNIELEHFQSNHEGEIVEKIQQSKGNYHGIIINPGAYTHTSVAIRDALIFAELPAVEVHISNVYKRENFRQISYISDVVDGKIVGLGTEGYVLALFYLASKLKKINLYAMLEKVHDSQSS